MLIIHRLFAAVLLVLCSICLIQAEEPEVQATKWRELDLDLKKLNAWGKRSYAYSLLDRDEKLKPMGRVVLSTEVAPDGVVLKDHWDLIFHGERMKLEMEYTCRMDNFLSPVKLKSRGHGDEVASFEVEIADGKAVVAMEGKDLHEMDLPQDTITTAALMRLVTLLPTAPGKTYAYGHSLEAEELHLKKDYLVKMVGAEAIIINEEEFKCSKFEVTGGGVAPSYYWVDENRRLMRILIDDRKLIELVLPQDK